jgi:hypothetical protein
LFLVTTLSKFEKEVEQKQGRSTTVGTREYLLEKARNEGVMLGVKKAEKLLLEERKKRCWKLNMRLLVT